MSGQPRSLPIIVRRVNFWWYPIAIVPILALGYFAFSGALPAWVAMVALFAFFLWLFSLIFAAYAVFQRKRKEPKP